MKIFISGGCKNGKSTYAQQLAVSQRRPLAPLYYVATMQPVDTEDDDRIARHVREREGQGFETVEMPRDIGRLIMNCEPNGSFLLDSLTALLSNEMFAGGILHPDVPAKIAGELATLLQTIDDIVIVSDFIYSDAALYNDWTEYYRKGLALLDKTAARACDVVLEACFGDLIIHKGADYYQAYQTVY